MSRVPIKYKPTFIPRQNQFLAPPQNIRRDTFFAAPCRLAQGCSWTGSMHPYGLDWVGFDWTGLV